MASLVHPQAGAVGQGELQGDTLALGAHHRGQGRHLAGVLEAPLPAGVQEAPLLVGEVPLLVGEVEALLPAGVGEVLLLAGALPTHLGQVTCRSRGYHRIRPAGQARRLVEVTHRQATPVHRLMW